MELHSTLYNTRGARLHAERSTSYVRTKRGSFFSREPKNRYEPLTNA